MYENDFCEYAVLKKKEGSYLVKLCIFIILAIVLAAVVLTVILPRYGAVGFLAAAALACLIWYVSRYFYIECEYSQSGAYIDFSYVYSKQYRKDKLSIDLKKTARKVAPYDGKFSGFNVKEVLDMRSSSKTPYAYMIVYEANGSQHAVLFDATKRLVNNLYHQIPSMVVTSNELPEE